MSDDLFKAEDFHLKIVPLNSTGRYGVSQFGLDFAIEAANISNRIHRERLAKGTVVYGCLLDRSDENSGWVLTKDANEADTHTAILVCVKPIEPADSAERVLADLLKLNNYEDYYVNNQKRDSAIMQIMERARKLINKKETK